MRSAVEKLAASEGIIEWIDPDDQRLVIATGEPMPNSGGATRTEWVVECKDEERVASEVKRLLVPNEHLLKGLVHAVFVRDALGYQDEPGIGNITVTFTDEQDWHENFPIERTEIHPIMFARKGIKSWAAVGICSDEIGISVFSKQTVDGGVLARVQYVPDDILRKILEA